MLLLIFFSLIAFLYPKILKHTSKNWLWVLNRIFLIVLLIRVQVLDRVFLYWFLTFHFLKSCRERADNTVWLRLLNLFLPWGRITRIGFYDLLWFNIALIIKLPLPAFDLLLGYAFGTQAMNEWFRHDGIHFWLSQLFIRRNCVLVCVGNRGRIHFKVRYKRYN